MPLKEIYLCTLLILALAVPAFSNNTLRHWNLEDGRQIHASLIEYEEEADRIYLQVKEKENLYLKLEDFSTLDQAWLVEWARISEDLEQILEKLPGRFTTHQFIGELDYHDFYVYEPSAKQKSTKRPLMFLIGPGPKSMRYMMRHLEAAETTGITIVAMDRFGNSHTNEEAEKNMERFIELLPHIEATVAHDPKQLYLGGTSGGALRAINWANQIDRPWKGIYSNGGWLGYNKNLFETYKQMKLIVVNGNNDRASNQYLLKRDLDILLKNEVTVGIIAFEGGHQIPPLQHQIMAFEWLLDSESVEKLSTAEDLQPTSNQLE